MVKGIAIAFGVALLALLGWVVLHSSDISVVVNGRKLAGPALLAAEGWGVLVTSVGLLCVVILLTFVFAGVWLILLGAFVFSALLFSWAAFPFLLPVLVPLAIVWAFVAILQNRRGRR